MRKLQGNEKCLQYKNFFFSENCQVFTPRDHIFQSEEWLYLFVHLSNFQCEATQIEVANICALKTSDLHYPFSVFLGAHKI